MVVWSVILQPPVQKVTPPPPASNDTTALLGWLAGLALAVIIVTVVAQPLKSEAKRRKQPLESHRLEISQLEGMQESALAESHILEDLEFDRELGIMDDRDYTELKQRSEIRLDALHEQINQLQHKIGGNTLPSYEKTSGVLSHSRVSSSNTDPHPASATATKSKTGETGKFYFKAAIKEKLKCSECGTPFKPGDRFCHQCSAPLPLLCLTCGKEVTEDDRFCAGCGSAVNT